ncbi:MAG: IS3 family transposase [Pseudomonadota bacterium]
MNKKSPRYSPEVRERAVRLFEEALKYHSSRWAATKSVAEKIGCTTESLRRWVKQAEIDQGKRDGLSTSERQELKALKREVKELKRANEILKTASGFFRPGGARPPVEEMIAYIDQHKDRFGVEPLCALLPISSSSYYDYKAREADPDLQPNRWHRDQALKPEIQRVFDENRQVYGARKIWKQLHRECIAVARCTVERLMKVLGIQGVVRGKGWKTTIPDEAADRPSDLVNRAFVADGPNQLWVADFTYVATWQGVVFTAFIIDVFSRMIVGWRVSRTMKTDLVMDALEQALHARQVDDGLIHHSDRGSQYLSIRYTERLAEEGVVASVGSVGDSYDNALAESVIGLYKAELIEKKRPWKNLNSVEYETFKYVDWFNHRRLMESLGDVPPTEFEQDFYEAQNGQATAV